jgi:hypothetical protein
VVSPQVVQFCVVDALVGSIIGKGGTLIKETRGQSGATVIVANLDSRSDLRLVTVCGSFEQVSKALELLSKCLNNYDPSYRADQRREIARAAAAAAAAQATIAHAQAQLLQLQEQARVSHVNESQLSAENAQLQAQAHAQLQAQAPAAYRDGTDNAHTADFGLNTPATPGAGAIVYEAKSAEQLAAQLLAHYQGHSPDPQVQRFALHAQPLASAGGQPADELGTHGTRLADHGVQLPPPLVPLSPQHHQATVADLLAMQPMQPPVAVPATGGWQGYYAPQPVPAAWSGGMMHHPALTPPLMAPQMGVSLPPYAASHAAHPAASAAPAAPLMMPTNLTVSPDNAQLIQALSAYYNVPVGRMHQGGWQQ